MPLAFTVVPTEVGTQTKQPAESLGKFLDPRFFGDDNRYAVAFSHQPQAAVAITLVLTADSATLKPKTLESGKTVKSYE